MSSQEKIAVPLLDVLMTLREDMTARGRGPYQYIGMPDVEHVTGFIVGYSEGLDNLEVEVGTDALFRDWLRDVKKALPGQGWAAAYLAEFQGDQERALRKYLDFVAEFRALPPQSLATLRWLYQGPHPALRTPSWTFSRPPPTTLDVLLNIRQEVGTVPGRLGMFIGTIDVRRMAGFVDGYRLCLALAGARDEEYPRFERWLHEEKSLPAGQEWPRLFLQACQGDDEQAIHRLLGFAAEFRSARPHS
ncbi:hypothetical protein [Cystobacter fuscus]|uniref:hypothetical protein n=1 Tax=Cystobacter fuscus TaxID=43 RepID=UPI002B2F215B|nr:hypothetical protein F0U63_01075 [Cystobacter fuscus]